MPKQKAPLTIPEIMDEVRKLELKDRLEIQRLVDDLIAGEKLDIENKLKLIAESKK